MPVQVHNHAHLNILVKLTALFFGLPHFRVVELVTADLLAVEVDSGQTAAVVAINNPIGVDHGHHFEDEVVPQYFGFEGV